jgi:nucleotide-binding universal stress UspA family protein
MSQSLLVVYDGSPSGDEGVGLACAAGRLRNQAVEILSVTTVHRSLPLADLPDWLDERAELRLARARDIAFASGSEIDTRLVRDYDLTQAVLRECQRIQPAGVFLAIESSSKPWLPAFLPGLARRLMQKAKCPVYLVNAPESRGMTPREVLSESERVLRGTA